MTTYPGEVRIKTTLDAAGINAGLSKATAMLGKLALAIGVGFSVNAIVNFSKAAVEAASKSETAWSGLGFVMNANNRSLTEAKGFLEEYVSDGLVPMTDAIKAYQNMVMRGYDTGQIEDMLTVMKDSAAFGRQGQYSMGEAIEKATQGLRMENSLLTDSVGIQTNVAKMWDAYARSIGTTASTLTLAQKRQAEYNGFLKEGGIFAGAAAQYAGTYAGRVSQLGTAFYNLRVAVGNAIIPILNQIIPVIIQVVNWFTRLFNIVGQVMNLLFGTSVSMRDVEDGASGAADGADDFADGMEAAERAAKGTLASFDKINVLAREDGNGEGSGSLLPVIEPGDGLPPNDSMTAGLETLRLKIEELKLAAADLFAPLITSIGNLMIALEPLKTFVATGLQSFYDNLLVPIGTWVVGEGLPTFVDTLTAMANNLDLTGMNESLTNLWNAIAPFAINVGEGLLWFWDEVLAPIVTWAWNDLVPAFLDLLTAAVDALNSLLGNEGGGASQGIKNFWDVALSPILNFANTLIIGIINDLTAALKAFGDWCSQNEGIVSLMTTLILEFLAGLWVYTTAKKVATWITVSLIPALDGLAISLAGLNLPLVLSVIAVAALATGITALALVWDQLTPAQRTESMLRGLAAALIAAAIAVAVFHTSWTVGIAAAAIVGGLALLASASFLSGMSIPDIFSQGLGSLSALEGAVNTNYSASPLPALATGAVIPANAPFAAILGDQKHGTNIEAPESLIRKIVREETGRTRNTEGTIHNVIKLDGQVLYDAFKKIDRRVGTSLITGSGIR